MIDLLFCYAHEDEAMRDELETHLAMLKRSGLVRAWHDRRISAGSDLDHEISQYLERADVILLLLSPHFLASDYCYEREAKRALELHAKRKAIVIPVILQPCDWRESPFKDFRATPNDGKPVSLYPNMNEAFLEVTKDIRAAAQSLGKSEEPPHSALMLDPVPEQPASGKAHNLDPRSHLMQETLRTLVAYTQGIESAANNVALATNDSVLDDLKKRYDNLFKPVFQCVLHDAVFLPKSRGHRLINGHPNLTLVRPIAWSDKRFNLWQQMSTTVFHLQDFAHECEVLLGHGGAPAEDVTAGRRLQLESIRLNAAMRRLMRVTAEERQFLDLFSADDVVLVHERTETWLSNAAYNAGLQLVQDRAVHQQKRNELINAFTLESSLIDAWGQVWGDTELRRTSVEVPLDAVWGTGDSGGGLRGSFR